MNPPSAATGDAADEIVDEARKQTRTRRELAASDGFAELSPEVGELDEQLLADRLDTDPDSTLELLSRLTGATDEALRRRARRLAAELFPMLAARYRVDHGGIGRITSVRDDGEPGDLDLDASIEVVAEARAARRALETGELMVRRWKAPSTAWCLLVDRSGSMHGAPLATAAMAAAAVSVRAAEPPVGERAIVAFGRDRVAVEATWEQRPDVIDRLLSLRGTGSTDVAAALRTAADQLLAATASRRVTVLLSDCRSTEPGDAVAAAAALDELVILTPDSDTDAARDLAESVGARWASIDGPSSVPAALAAVLD